MTAPHPARLRVVPDSERRSRSSDGPAGPSSSTVVNPSALSASGIRPVRGLLGRPDALRPVGPGTNRAPDRTGAALLRRSEGAQRIPARTQGRADTAVLSQVSGSAPAPAPVRRDGIIRRRSALTTKQIVSALRGIPQFKQKMDETFRDETVQERIEQTLRSYKAHIATKKDEDVDIRDAMMLSAALERIAHQFAEQLNDPSVTAALMPKMFEVFESEIGGRLKKKRGMGRNARGRVLALAKTLSGADPVTGYMHREIRKEIAAQQIITMAGQHASLTPTKVFDLMAERWQAALSTYSKDQQKATVTDPVADFNRAEAHGEYSPEFFRRTFGSQEPTWQPGGNGAAESLTLTADAQRMLADLRAEVIAPSAQVAVQPRAGVTAGQERHLAELEAAEGAMASVDADFLALFNERYHLTAQASRDLLADIRQFLNTDMKLTITVNLEKWFGTDTAPQTPRQMFAPAVSAKDTTRLQDLFNKATQQTIEHIPTWDDSHAGASARGPSYLRFRHWKDQLMTGLQDLSSGEMASFGAGNITWDTAKGSDTAAGYGTNYYGDLHFVLDRSKFGSRIVFTAGDHGEPRRQPLLALHDLCGEGKGRTWLRSVGDLAVVDNVVNAVRTRAPLMGLNLKLEFQVFGGIDMLDDVTEVWLAGKHSPQALQRVQAFYQGKRVAINVLGAAPPGTLEGGAGNLKEGLVPQLRPLVAYGQGLGAIAQQDLAATRTAAIGGATASISRDLLATSIVMSIGLERTARAVFGHLEQGDDAALTKAKDDLNRRWAAVSPQLGSVDAGLVNRVTTQVARANAAVDAALRGDPAGMPALAGTRANGGAQNGGAQNGGAQNGGASNPPARRPPPVPPRAGRMRQRRPTPARIGAD